MPPAQAPSMSGPGDWPLPAPCARGPEVPPDASGGGDASHLALPMQELHVRLHARTQYVLNVIVDDEDACRPRTGPLGSEGGGPADKGSRRRASMDPSPQASPAAATRRASMALPPSTFLTAAAAAASPSASPPASLWLSDPSPLPHAIDDSAGPQQQWLSPPQQASPSGAAADGPRCRSSEQLSDPSSPSASSSLWPEAKTLSGPAALPHTPPASPHSPHALTILSKPGTVNLLSLLHPRSLGVSSPGMCPAASPLEALSPMPRSPLHAVSAWAPRGSGPGGYPPSYLQQQQQREQQQRERPKSQSQVPDGTCELALDTLNAQAAFLQLPGSPSSAGAAASPPRSPSGASTTYSYGSARARGSLARRRSQGSVTSWSFDAAMSATAAAVGALASASLELGSPRSSGLGSPRGGMGSPKASNSRGRLYTAAGAGAASGGGLVPPPWGVALASPHGATQVRAASEAAAAAAAAEPAALQAPQAPAPCAGAAAATAAVQARRSLDLVQRSPSLLRRVSPGPSPGAEGAAAAAAARSSTGDPSAGQSRHKTDESAQCSTTGRPSASPSSRSHELPPRPPVSPDSAVASALLARQMLLSGNLAAPKVAQPREQLRVSFDVGGKSNTVGRDSDEEEAAPSAGGAPIRGNLRRPTKAISEESRTLIKRLQEMDESCDSDGTPRAPGPQAADKLAEARSLPASGSARETSDEHYDTAAAFGTARAPVLVPSPRPASAAGTAAASTAAASPWLQRRSGRVTEAPRRRSEELPRQRAHTAAGTVADGERVGGKLGVVDRIASKMTRLFGWGRA